MKKRATVKIDDYYDEIIASSHIMQGSFIDEDEQTQTVILLTNDMFKDYTDNLFYDRSLPIKIEEGETIEESVLRTFGAHWSNFVAANQHNFNRIVEALYTYYNPLYNYNKKLHSENVKTGSEADSNTRIYGATSDTLTKSGSEQLTSVKGAKEHNSAESGQITDTHNVGARQNSSEVATMDTNSYNPTGRVNEAAAVDSDVRTYTGHNVRDTDATYTDTDTRTYNNYQETNAGTSHTDSDSGSHTYNNVKDTYDEDMHGNIGVMESVTMIESELRLRKRQIGLELLQEFYDLYTYRVGGHRYD